MIKKIFYPGQTLLVSGSSEPYSIVDLFLIDPVGLIVHEKESFINKNGVLVCCKDQSLWITKAKFGH